MDISSSSTTNGNAANPLAAAFQTAISNVTFRVLVSGGAPDLQGHLDNIIAHMDLNKETWMKFLENLGVFSGAAMVSYVNRVSTARSPTRAIFRDLKDTEYGNTSIGDFVDQLILIPDDTLQARATMLKTKCEELQTQSKKRGNAVFKKNDVLRAWIVGAELCHDEEGDLDTDDLDQLLARLRKNRVRGVAQLQKVKDPATLERLGFEGMQAVLAWAALHP